MHAVLGELIFTSRKGITYKNLNPQEYRHQKPKCLRYSRQVCLQRLINVRNADKSWCVHSVSFAAGLPELYYAYSTEHSTWRHDATPKHLSFRPFRVGNGRTRAGPKDGPVGQLSGVSTHERREAVTGITGNRHRTCLESIVSLGMCPQESSPVLS